MLRFLSRRGLSRGLEGSRGWLAVGVVAWAVRLLVRLARRAPQVVYESRLEPGETLVIEHHTDTYLTQASAPETP